MGAEYGSGPGSCELTSRHARRYTFYSIHAVVVCIHSLIYLHVFQAGATVKLLMLKSTVERFLSHICLDH